MSCETEKRFSFFCFLLLVQKLISTNGIIEPLVNWIRAVESITFFNIGRSKRLTITSSPSPVTFLIGKTSLKRHAAFDRFDPFFRDSEDTMLLIMKEILRLDQFEPEPQYETIEQMIKSNVLNYFVNNQTTKLNELRPYLAKSESFTKSTNDLIDAP